MNNGGSYKLIIKSINGCYEDYAIYYKSIEIGILQLVDDEVLFIRNIRIYSEYRGKGHATKIMDLIIMVYNKDISLCITTISESAIYFWNKYLNSKNNVEHVRGNIYKIRNTRGQCK